MKVARLGLCAGLCAGIAAGAQAQSSVTMYGLLSAGLGYATNQSGSHTLQALSGTNQNPRWGMRGSEDLGGGNRAIFTLEAGFSVMTGKAAQNGRAFGRQSFVGLASRDYGTLTLGRQYDAIHDYIGPVVIASNGVNVGDNDNGYNDIRVQHAIKYVTPDFGGLSATALYGFSNAAGAPGNNNAYSLGVRYARGPVEWSVVYAQYNTPYSTSNQDGAIGNDYASPVLLFSKSAVHPSVYAGRQKIAGTGGFYEVGKARWGAMFTDVRFDYLDNSHLRMQNFDLTLNYQAMPQLVLGAAYAYTQGRYDVIGTHPKWHQVNLQADYFLSKRTDVILTAIVQRAAGDATNAQVFGYDASTSRQQAVVTLGLRHKF